MAKQREGKKKLVGNKKGRRLSEKREGKRRTTLVHSEPEPSFCETRQ
jgi:hypothetical protein